MNTVAPSLPKSLLQFAGAPLYPAALSNAVLLLIDFQGEYTAGSLRLPDAASALAEAGVLLRAARAAGTPIIHVVHHGRPGGALFDPAGPHVAIDPAVAPLPDEVIVQKGLPNSFAQTGLHELIQAAGRKELILAGFMTHLCVSATARSALDHGYRSTVVASATATRDLPDPAGGLVAAALVHQATLAALADRFAIVVQAAADIPA